MRNKTATGINFCGVRQEQDVSDALRHERHPAIEPQKPRGPLWFCSKALRKASVAKPTRWHELQSHQLLLGTQFTRKPTQIKKSPSDQDRDTEPLSRPRRSKSTVHEKPTEFFASNH